MDDERDIKIEIETLERLSLGLKRKTVELIDYIPGWSTAFSYVEKNLRKVLPHSDFQIEHIGSTAIPGCIAKPVLDILITFINEDNRACLVNNMLNTGFIHRGECGVANRSYFNLYNEDETREYIHLHGYIIGHEEVYNLLRFRDNLIANKDLMARYMEHKRAIKNSNISRKEYLGAKTWLIKEFLQSG